MNPGIGGSFIFCEKTVLITSKCRATFGGLSITWNREKEQAGAVGIMPQNVLPPFNFLRHRALALISTFPPSDWQMIIAAASTSSGVGLM